MKLTKSLFAFPAIMYDGIEMIKRETNELEKEFSAHEGIMPYAVGTVKIPFSEIKSYEETWVKGTLIDDIINNGFECTSIVTETLGEYMCKWNLKTLEERLDKFQERLEKMLEEELEKQENK